MTPALHLQRCPPLPLSKPWTGNAKVSWSKGEESGVGNAQQLFNSPNSPFQKGRLRSASEHSSLGCVLLLAAEVSARRGWEQVLATSSPQRSTGAPRTCPSWHCFSVTKRFGPGTGATVLQPLQLQLCAMFTSPRVNWMLCTFPIWHLLKLCVCVHAHAYMCV